VRVRVLGRMCGPEGVAVDPRQGLRAPVVFARGGCAKCGPRACRAGGDGQLKGRGRTVRQGFARAKLQAALSEDEAGLFARRLASGKVPRLAARAVTHVGDCVRQGRPGCRGGEERLSVLRFVLFLGGEQKGCDRFVVPTLGISG